MSFLVVNSDSIESSECSLDDIIIEGVLDNFRSCINSKTLVSNAKVIPLYYSYVSRPTVTPRGELESVPAYMLATFLMSCFSISLTTSTSLVKTLNSKIRPL